MDEAAGSLSEIVPACAPQGYLLCLENGGIVDLNPAASEILSLLGSPPARGMNMSSWPAIPFCQNLTRCFLPFPRQVPARNFLRVTSTPITRKGLRAILLTLESIPGEEVLILNRGKDFVLTRMSHELRNAVNAALGISGELLSGKVPDDLREGLSRLEIASRSALRHLDDILDFALIEAGGLEFDEKIFSLSRSCRDALGMVRQDARKKGLHLFLEVDPSVPSPVKGDSFRLEQILRNLLGNAVKFTASGSISLGVRPALGGENRVEILFTVADTGSGIPRNDLPHVFDEFVRIHRPGNGTGAGLGLPICRRLASAMGGSIRVESAEGTGSVFFLTLPFSLPTREEREEWHEVRQVWEPPQPGEKAVLVAEDNPLNREIAAANLRRMGYAVRTATSGNEVLSLFREGCCTLILMDVQMPGMDGLETASAIRKSEAETGGHVPIIALTAYAMAEDRRKCLAAGMDDFISKPFTPDQLSLAVRKALHREAAPLRILEFTEGDIDLARNIVEEFLKVAPPLLEEMRHAGEEGNLKKLAALAHRMKGNLAYLGAEKGMFLAGTIEDKAHDLETPSQGFPGHLLDEFFSEMGALLSALRREWHRVGKFTPSVSD